MRSRVVWRFSPALQRLSSNPQQVILLPVPVSTAPLSALCVTSIAVLESLRSSASLRQRLVAAGVGVGLVFSAYLWLADEAGSHPANLDFLAALGLVWGLVAGIVIVFFLIALLTRTPNR